MRGRGLCRISGVKQENPAGQARTILLSLEKIQTRYFSAVIFEKIAVINITLSSITFFSLYKLTGRALSPSGRGQATDHYTQL